MLVSRLSPPSLLSVEQTWEHLPDTIPEDDVHIHLEGMFDGRARNYPNPGYNAPLAPHEDFGPGTPANVLGPAMYDRPGNRQCHWASSIQTMRSLCTMSLCAALVGAVFVFVYFVKWH